MKSGLVGLQRFVAAISTSRFHLHGRQSLVLRGAQFASIRGNATVDECPVQRQNIC